MSTVAPNPTKEPWLANWEIVNTLGKGGQGTTYLVRHGESGRKGALVALNCAALPESLMESELFGIEGGVATGVEARRGKFELAHEGTLFLDEIGDMNPAVQCVPAPDSRRSLGLEHRRRGRRSPPIDLVRRSGRFHLVGGYSGSGRAR